MSLHVVDTDTGEVVDRAPAVRAPGPMTVVDVAAQCRSVVTLLIVLPGVAAVLFLMLRAFWAWDATCPGCGRHAGTRPVSCDNQRFHPNDRSAA